MKPRRYIVPVIAHYMQFVDVRALQENLKLTPDQRLRKLQRRVTELERQQSATTEKRTNR